MLRLKKAPPKIKDPPATLLQRQEILLYCLKSTKHEANYYSHMTRPEMDAEDIQSEVKIRVWRAMVKKEYLNKTYDELIRIGYVTAHRWISDIVRDHMSTLVRGANALHVSINSPQVNATTSLLLGKNYSTMSPISKVLVFETITNEAIRMVGLRHYKALIRAIPFDWASEEELTHRQCNILSNLDCSQNDLVEDLHILAKRVRKKLKPEGDTDSQTSKIHGMWVQNTECPRHAIV